MKIKYENNENIHCNISNTHYNHWQVNGIGKVLSGNCTKKKVSGLLATVLTLQLDSIYFLHPLQFPVIPCFIRTIVLSGWRGTSFVTGWDEKTVHAGGETFSSHLPLQRWPSKSHPGAPDLGHWRGNGLWKNHTDSTVPSRRCKFWNEPMNDFQATCNKL